MRLKVIRKWPIHRKTPLFCALLFFPFKFLQQNPVSAVTRSPPHIRFDYFFSFGITRAGPNGSQDRKVFHLEKVLIGDNFEKKKSNRRLPICGNNVPNATQNRTSKRVTRNTNKTSERHKTELSKRS